jgi:hypothetical protein
MENQTMRKKIWAALLAIPLAAVFLMTGQPVAAHADGGPWNLTTVQNINGRWERFWIGSDCHVHHAWGATNPDGPFTGSGSLGGCVLHSSYFGLDVGMNHDGRLEVFAVGKDHAMWHDWQTKPGSGPWSGWYSIHGGFYGNYGRTPNVVSEFSTFSNIHIYGWYNKQLYVDYQTKPGCCWSGWQHD